MKSKLLGLSLLSICLFISISGCISYAIYEASGIDLKSLRGMTRTQINEKLGEPFATYSKSEFGTLGFDIKPYLGLKPARIDKIKYIGKINNDSQASGYLTTNAVTLGIGEIVLIPAAIGDAISRSSDENIIVVIYDQNDRSIILNQERLPQRVKR